MFEDLTEKYPDVLQNIEFAIVRAYETDRSLLDLDVMDLLDAAIRRYSSEAQGRSLAPHRLAERTAAAYKLVDRMCEFRLGRETMGGAEGTAEIRSPEIIGLEVLVACLKRVRKSARFWNERAGRQGYLDYVSRFT